jgi:probable HAF family extracellular repeat protein
MRKRMAKDKGNVVGYATDAGRHNHAFLVQPGQ